MAEMLYVQCQGTNDAPCQALYPRGMVPADCLECGATPIETQPWDPKEDETSAPVEEILFSLMTWLEETQGHHDTNGQLHQDYRDALIVLAECLPDRAYLWEEEEETPDASA